MANELSAHDVYRQFHRARPHSLGRLALALDVAAAVNELRGEPFIEKPRELALRLERELEIVEDYLIQACIDEDAREERDASRR